MAITQPTMDLILAADRKLPGIGKKVLFLGYQELLLSNSYMDRNFGPSFRSHLSMRPDAEKWQAIHRADKYVDKVDVLPELGCFFEKLGYSVDIIDSVDHTGSERNVDLNFPVSQDLFGQYDLVVDGGTLEHCCNCGQAIVNVLAMCKVGGYIIHSNPFTYINHGYFNFNPILYQQFYSMNGGTVIEMEIASWPTCSMKTYPILTKHREARVQLFRLTGSLFVILYGWRRMMNKIFRPLCKLISYNRYDRQLDMVINTLVRKERICELKWPSQY